MRTSKSPAQILKTALAVGRKALRAYSHRFSPKTFTQPQLFACLVLKESLKLDYRGVSELLDDTPSLREAIGLTQVPHGATLQKPSKRLLKRRRVQRLLDQTLGGARQGKLRKKREDEGEVDSG